MAESTTVKREAITDTDRLDWIERQDLSNLVFDRSDDRVAVILGGAVYGKTLREAIDAAMRDTP